MPARAATLSYGLVTMPVKLEVATITRTSLSYLCVGQPGHEAHTAKPTRMPKTCDDCGPITDTGALVRGVKSGKTYTLVDAEKVEEAEAEFATKHPDLNIAVHDAGEFLADTSQGSTLHYVVPTDAATANHYQLLVRLVRDHPEKAFALLHTPRSVTSVYVLRVRDGVLLLEQRKRQAELKPTPSVGGEVNEALYTMLEGQLDMLTTPYDAANYEDHYAPALAEIIAAGEQVTVEGERATAAPVLSDDDLMAKLAALQSA